MSGIKFKIYILLSLYLFGSFQVFIPYVEYYINFDFIVENLCREKENPDNCCKGSCYLNDQLVKKIAEQEDNPQNREKEHNLQLLAQHFINSSINLNSNKPAGIKYLLQNSPGYNNLVTEPNLPPPRYC